MRLKLINFNDIIGTRTRDLPACSEAPQASTLSRTPDRNIFFIIQPVSESELVTVLFPSDITNYLFI
jgi:hypothetical protein